MCAGVVGGEECAIGVYYGGKIHLTEKIVPNT